ncbi:MAG: Hsp20/alpha crystallin family protein [Phormidesmis sp.]
MPITRWQPFNDIRHWEPFGEINTLQKEMNQLLEQFMPRWPENGDGFAFAPSAEIDETESEIHLKLEVPGIQADDLDIEVMDKAVTIKGERKSETETKEKDGFRSEFYYGQFERTIPMPTRIQKENVSAEYTDGVLRLTIPKAPQAEEKAAVKVKVA